MRELQHTVTIAALAAGAFFCWLAGKAYQAGHREGFEHGQDFADAIGKPEPAQPCPKCTSSS